MPVAPIIIIIIIAYTLAWSYLRFLPGQYYNTMYMTPPIYLAAAHCTCLPLTLTYTYNKYE